MIIPLLLLLLLCLPRQELEDRWERISAAVPGKTKSQCFKRFKELKEVFKAGKPAAGAQ